MSFYHVNKDTAPEDGKPSVVCDCSKQRLSCYVSIEGRVGSDVVYVCRCPQCDGFAKLRWTENGWEWG